MKTMKNQKKSFVELFFKSTGNMMGRSGISSLRESLKTNKTLTHVNLACLLKKGKKLKQQSF